MTTLIHQPNDKLFKLSMTDIVVATEFFGAHLPEALLKKLDLSQLKLEKESFVSEVYKSTEADVVYSVPLGNTTAYLYLLCEQQTEVDASLAFRLLGYILRIMELHKKQHPDDFLPLVYPIVVYTGEEAWNAPLDIFPLFGEAESLARKILFKPFQLLDIHRISDKVLHENLLSGLVAFVIKYRKTADFEQFLKKFMPWLHEAEIFQDQTGAFLGRILLRYVVDHSSQGNQELLVQEAQHYLSQTLTGEIMTIAEQWKQEGIQKGMLIAEQWKQEGIQKGMLIAEQWKQEGIQKGMQQGEANLLIKQLTHRFGTIPLSYIQSIRHADADTLLIWGERVLDAKTIEDVFK